MTEAIFTQLVGQSRAKGFLGKALSQESLPQTLIFAGPAGLGKRTCAGLLAEHLCGENSADVFVFSAILNEMRERKVPSPIIESVRELTGFLAKSPLAAKYKVGILDEAEALSVQAQNALLKTLEEPRADTVLIITVGDENLLLPTIRSRAQVVKFAPLSREEIKNAVPNATEVMLDLAAGSLGWVQEMANDDANWTAFQALIAFWKNLDSKNVVERFGVANAQSERAAAQEFLRVGILVMRETLLRDLSPATVLKIVRMQKARQQIDDNVNVKLALEAMFLQI